MLYMIWIVLNVAPLIMRSIMRESLLYDRLICKATLMHIDGIYINKDTMFATRVREHLSDFGLISKDLELLEDSDLVLVLSLGGAWHSMLKVRKKGCKCV